MANGTRVAFTYLFESALRAPNEVSEANIRRQLSPPWCRMNIRPFVVSLECRPSTSAFAYSALGGPIITHRVYPGSPSPVSYNITDMLYRRHPGEQFGPPLSWGWDARVKHSLMQPEERLQHEYVVDFKPDMTHTECDEGSESQHQYKLLFGKLVADYLRELSSMAKATLKTRYGACNSVRKIG